MSSVRASGRLIGSVLLERYDYTPGPAVSLDRHTHERYQLCFNPDFVGQVWIGGEWHVVPRGEMTLVPPGETHAVRDVADRTTSGTYRVLYVEPELFGTASFGSFQHAGGPLARRFERLHQVLERPATRLEREDRIVAMLAELRARFDRPVAVASALGPQPALLARDYLHDHVSDNVGLSDLARQVNLSPYHLLRVFRRDFGLTPHGYQMQARVEHAKRFLARGATVTQAAHDSGFFDSSHLNRHFRRVVGVTPVRYAGR